MRAAVYARLSRDPDGTAESVARQVADCRRLAESRGWEVAVERVDRDRSASNRRVTREAWEALLGDVQSGSVEVVIAWRADRLARRASDMARLRDVLEESGARLVTVSDGLDTSTPAGSFTLGIMAEVAQAEARAIADRTRRAKEESRAQGRPKHGGHRGFGHDRDGRLVPDEAELIRDAVRRILAGESMASIARDWSAAGIVTPTGRPWATTHLRRMLRQARLAGAREAPTGEWVATGAIEPIVSEADLRRLRGIVDDPARVTRTPRKHENLLTGIAFCALCGARLVTHTVKGRQVYTCASRPERRACGGVAVTAALADAHVEAEVLRVIESPALLDALAALPAEESTGAVVRELEQDRLALDRAAMDYYVSRTLSESAYAQVRSSLEARIAEAERRLSAAAGVSLLGVIDPERVRSTWSDGSLDWRRAVVRVLVERVDVSPAERPVNVWRPERLSIVPRFGRSAGANSATSSPITS